MICHTGGAVCADENDSDSDSQAPACEDTPGSGKGKRKCAFRWADCNAFQTTDAFRRLNLDQFVDREMAGADAGAFAAIDAGLRFPTNSGGANQRGQAHESAVGTQVTAPGIANNIDATTRMPMKIAAPVDKNRKKLEIFTSAIKP